MFRVEGLRIWRGNAVEGPKTLNPKPLNLETLSPWSLKPQTSVWACGGIISRSAQEGRAQVSEGSSNKLGT